MGTDLWQAVVAWWWKPRFFPSRFRPRLLLVVNLLVARLCVWGPYPFVTLAIGPLWKADQLAPRRHKVRAFQMYLGLKCPGGTPKADDRYYYEYTVKETGAIRLHYAAITPQVEDMAGA